MSIMRRYLDIILEADAPKNWQDEPFRSPQDVEDTHARFAKHYQHSPADKRALQKLTRDSTDLNRHLHQQYADKGKIVNIKRTSELDRAIAKFEAPHAFDVYTGAAHAVKPGIYHHAGYLHTSLSPIRARGFANVRWHNQKTVVDGKPYDIQDHHLIRIHVPQGQHGAYVGHISKSDKAKIGIVGEPSKDEYEFILPRNTKLLIHRHHTTKIEPYEIDGEKLGEARIHTHYATIESSSMDV